MNRRDIIKIASAYGLAGPFAGWPGFAWGDSRELKVGVEGISKVDPIVNRGKSTRDIARQVFDSLLFLEANGTLAPALITRWQPTGQTTWRLNVRQGVKWQDGTEFTVQDVAGQLSSETDCCCDTSKKDEDPDCENGKKDCPVDQMPTSPVLVKIIDDETLEVTFERSQPDFPLYLASPWHMMVKRNSNAAPYPVGTGPYFIKSADLDNNVNLRRNDTFWGKPPVYESIVFNNYPQQDAWLLKGDIQIANKIEDNERVQAMPDFIVRPFSERALVMALNLALLGGEQDNRIQLIKSIVGGAVARSVPAQLGRPAVGDFGAPQFVNFGGLVPYVANESLCTGRFDDPIIIVLIESAGSYKPVVDAIAEKLNDCGLQTDVKVMPFSETIERRDSYAALIFNTQIPVSPLGLVDKYAAGTTSIFSEEYIQLQPLVSDFRSETDLARFSHATGS